MILSWLNFQLFGPWSRQLSLLLEVLLLQRGDAVPLGLFAVFSLTELGTAHPPDKGFETTPLGEPASQ